MRINPFCKFIVQQQYNGPLKLRLYLSLSIPQIALLMTPKWGSYFITVPESVKLILPGNYPFRSLWLFFILFGKNIHYLVDYTT